MLLCHIFAFASLFCLVRAQPQSVPDLEIATELSFSTNHFPFLTHNIFHDQVLIYPNRQQLLKLQVDSGDDALNDRRNEKFKHFATFQDFLGDFLKIEYRAKQAKFVQMHAEKYLFKAFILPGNKLVDFSDELVRNALSILGDQESRRTHHSRHPQSQPPAWNELELPLRQLGEDMKSCERESFGKTGASSFISLSTNGMKGFAQYRINCMRIKTKVFVAIGLTRVIFVEQRNQRDQQDKVKKYCESQLRANVDYQYEFYTRKVELKISEAVIVEEPEETASSVPSRPPPFSGKNFTRETSLRTLNGIAIRGTPTAPARMIAIAFEDAQSFQVMMIYLRFNPYTGRVGEALITAYDPPTGNNRGQADNGRAQYVYNTPFAQGVEFSMDIVRRDHYLQIMVDGSHFAYVVLRPSINSIESINFYGDIHVSRTEFLQ